MKYLPLILMTMLGSLSTSVYAEASLGAQAKLIDSAGNQVGVVNMTEKVGESVKIEINAHGLSGGNHGMHIHTIGSCVLGSTPSFASAGAHFNPTGSKHGLSNKAGPHAGDLSNLSVKENGNVASSDFNDMFTLQTGKSNSLFDADGSAIIIHLNEDDYITDPTGNSGPRVACGVIEKKGN